jgi:hypothetical protein
VGCIPGNDSPPDAVRLPAEFRFEGTEEEVHRDPESGAVVLTGAALGQGVAG